MASKNKGEKNDNKRVLSYTALRKTVRVKMERVNQIKNRHYLHVSLSKTSLIMVFALQSLHSSSGRVSARGAAAGSAAACSGPRHLHRELPRAAAERRAARRPGQLPGPVQGPGAGPAQLQPTRPAAAR